MNKSAKLKKLKTVFFLTPLLKSLSNMIGFALAYRIFLGLSQFRQLARSMAGISLFIDVLNFLRTPLLLLTAKLMGLEAPLTFSKSAKWLYSTSALILSIISFIIPEISALILVILMVLAVTDAIVLLAKVCFSRYQENEALETATALYKEEQSKLLQIKLQILKLHDEEDNSDDPLQSLVGAYRLKQAILQQIKARYEKAAIKLHKNDLIRVIDKLIILGLSCLGFAASVLVIFATPIGLILFSVTSAMAVFYMLSRLLIEFYWPQKALGEHYDLETANEGHCREDKTNVFNLFHHFEDKSTFLNDRLMDKEDNQQKEDLIPKQNLMNKQYNHFRFHKTVKLQPVTEFVLMLPSQESSLH